MAYDPETGERGVRRVSALIEGEGVKELVAINLDGVTLTATDLHPFWVESLDTWISAEDLRLGDELLTATGRTPDVDGIIHYTLTSQTVYNLTVEGLHTFYVLAGDQAVLVHNAKGGKPGDNEDCNSGPKEVAKRPPDTDDPALDRETPRRPTDRLRPDPNIPEEVRAWNQAIDDAVSGTNVGPDHKVIVHSDDMWDDIYASGSYEKWKHVSEINGRRVEVHYVKNVDTGAVGHFKITNSQVI